MKEIAISSFVSECIANTKSLLPGYWKSTLTNRLSGGVGSVYDQFDKAEDLEEALKSLDWEETSHPAVMPGCRVFKANLVGRLGIVEIAKLPAGTQLIADDSKATGKVAMTVKGVRGEEVSYTYLIIGKEEGVDVVFTFHPGEPIRPSVVETAKVDHGSILSIAEARELGFELAKVV